MEVTCLTVLQMKGRQPKKNVCVDILGAVILSGKTKNAFCS